MLGKTFMETTRSTVLIDAEGSITNSWRNVKMPGHVQDVLATVRRL